MGFLSKLFGRKIPAQSADEDHAVIVRFNYGSTDLARLFELERELENVIESAGVGEFDGNDMAADGSNGIIYMYGPNADNLFDTVLPVLESTSFMTGAKATLRYGPPEAGVSETSRTVGT